MSSLRTPRSGARGTPMRQRPDVRSDRKVRQVNVGPNEVNITFGQYQNLQIYLT